MVGGQFQTLSAGRRQRSERARELARRAAALAVPADAAGRTTVEALSGQLLAVARIVSDLAEAAAEVNAVGAVARRTQPGGQDGTGALATLRANARLSSEAGRHALRLAVIAALAEVIVLATGLREGR